LKEIKMKTSFVKILMAFVILFSVKLRAITCDAAFPFRMGAGFPGDVNRTHPFSVVPSLMNVANRIRLFGDAAIVDVATNSVRGALATDTVTKIYGVLVRPFPTQQTTGGMDSAFGVGVPGTGVCDIIETGFVMVKCNNFATVQPAKGGAVHMRVAATAGALVQGGFHSAADGANTVLLTNARWNGPADASGIAELQVWAA
jgi:hypothetical protein